MIRWGEPGFVVAFTTRDGGVSSGPYESLNLGRSTGDDVALVDENRRRVCASLGLTPAASPTTGRCTRRSSTVPPRGCAERSATASGRTSRACRCSRSPPTACRSRSRRLHAGGSRCCTPAGVGLADGLVGAAVAALGGVGEGELTAVVGPGAGPCCYEVGPEVSSRFDGELTRGRKLDLWTVAERLLRAAGVARVERVDLCTICRPELFFSHRRDGKPRGVQGVLGYVT